MSGFITELVTVYEAVRNFLELGGPVLLFISILALLMWVLIFERLLYLFSGHKKVMQDTLQQWNNRADHTSWYAHQVRNQYISQVSLKLEKNLSVIKTLVVLCPLMGLLGTVTGMINVFDVMALSGTGNARSLAAGVSTATVPTMAGMVVALSGVFVSSWLHGEAQRAREFISEKMIFV